MPCTARRETRRCWAASAALDQARSRRSPTRPPAAATRSASDGFLKTTITRWPTVTRGREPTRPRQLEAPTAETVVARLVLCPPAATSVSVAAAARTVSRPVCPSDRRGVRIEGKVSRIGDGLGEAGGRGDHGRVVGGVRERSEPGVGQRRAELRVRGHAADDGDLLGARALRSLARPLDERADDGPLVARGEVGAPLVDLSVPKCANLVQERRLEAGEGEVEAGDARDREVVGVGVALAGQPVELGTARIAEAEQAGALVEGLAGGVVDGRTEHGVPAALANVEEQRVPSACEQA